MSLAIGIAAIVLLWVAGAPIFVGLLAGSIIIFQFYVGADLLVIPQVIYAAVNKYTLTAIPFFILVAAFLEAGGGEALFRATRAFLGHYKTGLAIAAIVACMFFGAVCGSGIATAVAIGAFVIPEMRATGYPNEIIASICGAGGQLGIIIPPSIAMIVIGDVTEAPVGQLFMGGLIPGIICTVFLCVAAWWQCRKLDLKILPKSGWGERGKSIVHAIPVLLLPLLILGTIYNGIATPTESACVAAVGSWVVGALIYRKLDFKRTLECLKAAAQQTAVIYCILFAAIMIGTALSYMRLPQLITEGVMSVATTKTSFMLLFLALFFFFGMIFDAFVLYYVCLPPLLGAIHFYGFDMVSFGILFVFVIMMAAITPPVCNGLYAGITITQADTAGTFKRVIPYGIAIGVTGIIVAFWPQMVLFLPRLMNA